MKNKSAFIFLILANVILLAHAVVPHHYHNENHISVHVDCSQEEEHNHHESVPFCHEEHEESETEACSIAETLVIPANQLRLIEMSAELESSQILFNSVFDYDFSLEDISVDNPYRIAENIPISSRFLISSQGYRAPPVC